MTRALLFLLACACAIACNTQRMICPAYQSSFYFDKTKQKESFFLYNENKNQQREVLASNSKTLNLPARDSAWDNSHVIQGPSLPFERKTKKEKYLLLPKRTYKQALRALQTVPMKPVYPKIGEDSADIAKELDSAARSITDTLTAKSAAKKSDQSSEDSVYVITTEKEKFNLDQDNYMWYFRDILVLPDVKQGIEAAQADKEAANAPPAKTKKGFFKGLFKRKLKQKNDTTSLKQQVKPEEENYETELDSVSTDSTAIIPQTKVDKPATTTGKKNKKKSKTEATLPPKKQEAKKEEKDGFE